MILVRKLGVPGHRELAMGAIGEGGVRVVNVGVVRAARVRDEELARIEAQERIELERRASRYRDDRPRLSVSGRDAVIVDDGLATGSTARAAIQVAACARCAPRRARRPGGATRRGTAAHGDRGPVVAVVTPERLLAIGSWYRDFSQIPDREVQRLLRDASV